MKNTTAAGAAACVIWWGLALLMSAGTNNVHAFSASVGQQQQQQQRSTPPTTKTRSTTPEERAAIAKQTWKTVALSTTPDVRQDSILLDNNNNNNTRVTVYNNKLFQEFCDNVQGTYYINGLSSCQVGNQLLHPFETHGFIKRLCFHPKNNDNGQLLDIKSAIIQTPLTTWERKFNLPLARGVMSTLGSPLFNAIAPDNRNTANLAATLWGSSGDNNNNNNNNNNKNPILIVGGDNGMPYVLDPHTLETLGPLSNYIPEFQGMNNFLAHTRIDEERNRLILVSSQFDISSPLVPAATSMTFYELDEHFNIVSQRSHTVDRFMVFHDWMISDNYYIVPKNPAIFKWDQLPKFILGLEPGTVVFDMDEASNGELILIPRHDSEAKVKECPAESFYNIFHFGPCYEETITTTTTSGNEKKHLLTVFASVFDKYTFGGEMGYDGKGDLDPIAWSSSDMAPAPRFDKFVIDLHSQTLVERTRIPLIDKKTTKTNNENDNDNDTIDSIDIPVDMPTFAGDGKACRYSYFVGAARPEGWFPFRSVVKTDLKTKETFNWDAGDDCITSEPMFVPKRRSSSTTTAMAPAEDDGFVLSIVHNSTSQTCDLVVLDSQQFHLGPIASIDLGTLMPWCVHGSWVPDFVPSSD